MTNFGRGPVEINQIHRAFWARETAKFDKRMESEVIRNAVLSDMRREIARGLPVRYQQSMEELAEANEDKLKAQHRAISGRGGSAKKQDVLTKLIVEIVRGKPGITTPAVLKELSRRGELGDGPILEATEEHISVQLPDGRIKSFAVAGLKDRVSRVRKALKLSKS